LEVFWLDLFSAAKPIIKCEILDHPELDNGPAYLQGLVLNEDRFLDLDCGAEFTEQVLNTD
jgi:hypothetical protein